MRSSEGKGGLPVFAAPILPPGCPQTDPAPLVYMAGQIMGQWSPYLNAFNIMTIIAYYAFNDFNGLAIRGLHPTRLTLHLVPACPCLARSRSPRHVDPA